MIFFYSHYLLFYYSSNGMLEFTAAILFLEIIASVTMPVARSDDEPMEFILRQARLAVDPCFRHTIEVVQSIKYYSVRWARSWNLLEQNNGEMFDPLVKCSNV